MGADAYVTIAATFLVAGAVKGVIGLGLPTISLALLTLAFDLPQAMVLMLIPSAVTNIWQGLVGGHLAVLLGRFWLFLLLVSGEVWFGTAALNLIALDVLTVVLGVLIVVYAGLGLSGWRIHLNGRQETWMLAPVAVINGVLTSMTGSFVVPAVMYLQSLDLSRNDLVQIMGLMFAASTFALGIGLYGRMLLPVDLTVASVAGVVPALLGMIIGQRVRGRLNEQWFRGCVLVGLLMTGVALIVYSRLS